MFNKNHSYRSCVLVIIVILLASFTQITIASSSVKVVIESNIISKDKSNMDHPKYGKGNEEKVVMEFIITVENISRDELKNIQVLAFPIAKSVDWNSDRRGKVVIHKKITKEVFETVASEEKITIEFDAEFSSFESGKGNTSWRGGSEYGGVGVKVFQDETLLEEKKFPVLQIGL